MKKLVLLSMLSVLFVACGKDGGLAAEEALQQVEEQKFYNQADSGACGLNVVSDYNSAVIECRGMSTLEEGRNCRSYFKKFLEKYPNINCEAETGYGLSKENITISYSKIQNTIDELNEILGQ